MRIIRPEDVKPEDFKEIAKGMMRELTPEELKEAYRLAREAFTAADLQKYTEPMDDGVLAEEVLAEMERRQQEWDQKRHEQSKEP
jgi:hypothetical protein